MAKLRVGVIGAGSWTVASHLPNLAARGDEVEFVGICRKGPDLLEKLRAQYDFAVASEDYRDVIAQDVGRALNPALVEGQMRGGATQGMGWALFEQLDHDESGHLLTGSFLDYAIPVADRVPDIETLIVEVPAPDGPFGAKGIGRASCRERVLTDV